MLEVMTMALVVAKYFSGNFVDAGELSSEQGYMPFVLSRSRFNRRLHRLKRNFLSLFAFLAERLKELNEESISIINTFPIAACNNYRICSSKRYRDKAYHGKQANKKRYFCGLKLQQSSSF